MTISRRGLCGAGLLAVASCGLPSWAASAPAKIRVGILKFGTVNWELDTIKHNGFDTANGVDVEMV